MAKKKNGPRDTTAALAIVHDTVFEEHAGGTGYFMPADNHVKLLRILVDMDARTGRRDPSKRSHHGKVAVKPYVRAKAKKIKK